MAVKFLIVSVLPIAIVCMYQTASFGQMPGQRITGYVLGEFERPLPAATVLLIDSKNIEVLETLAGSNGYFSLSHHVTGKYTIKISYTGYNPYRSELFDLTQKDLGRIRLTTQDVLDFWWGKNRYNNGHRNTRIIQFDRTLRAVNDYYYQQTNRYNANINYRYEHESGTMINLDADYGLFAKGNGNLQSNVYTNNQSAILSQNLYRSLNDIDIQQGRIK